MPEGDRIADRTGQEVAEGAPTSAIAVANAFLEIQAEDRSDFPPIDAMKLQKLVFYAHAWWLANKGKPLFSEDVEAWPWGPVVREVWEEFRGFGRRPIEGKRGVIFAPGAGAHGGWEFREPARPAKNIIEFLGDVWESHKSWTGVQLSNATHAEGEPWTVISKAKGGDLSDRPRIPNELIREIFCKKLRG